MNAFLRRAIRKSKDRTRLIRQIDINTMLLAGLQVDRVRKLPVATALREAEFKVFSQGGEDGIIQFLLAHVPVANRVFIEFGVQDYQEANTRYLLLNDDWKGLVIDGSAVDIEDIRQDRKAYARHDLTPICGFITIDNIDQLFRTSGFSGDIGLLSVDIDGNDYWVWSAIQEVSPRIVVCEYNSVFGASAPISVPYDPQFNRTKAHYSNLYFGASLPALCHLAEKKGYDFVGSNSMGSNAFFVRKDLSHALRRMTAKEGYVKSTHRADSRDEKGHLSHIGGDERFKLIEHLPVVDVLTNRTMTLAESVRMVV